MQASTLLSAKPAATAEQQKLQLSTETMLVQVASTTYIACLMPLVTRQCRQIPLLAAAIYALC
jgi:hypothetical protein